MGSTKADYPLLFTRQPDHSQHGQYLGDIRKSLASDFSIADDLKHQAITIGQHKPCISKVKLMLFKVYSPFRLIPYHNYRIYDNTRLVNRKSLKEMNVKDVKGWGLLLIKTEVPLRVEGKA